MLMVLGVIMFWWGVYSRLVSLEVVVLMVKVIVLSLLVLKLKNCRCFLFCFRVFYKMLSGECSSW